MTGVKDRLAQFAIDTQASLFTVQAFAAGIAAVVAHSPKFAIREMVGHMTFAPDSMQDASVQMTINAQSLEIMDEVNSAERREIERVMFDEVLESRFFPKIEYRSSRVSPTKLGENMYRLKVLGDLTLHGMTRVVTVEPQLVAGEDTVRAQGSFTLLQSDFGLKIASVAGGSLKLKNELKFGYFLIGRRQD